MVDADHHHHHHDEEELSSSSPKMKKEKKKKEKKRKRSKDRETEEEEEVNGGNSSSEITMKDPDNVEKDEKKKKKKKKKEKHQEANNNTTSDGDDDTDMVKTTGNEKEDKKVARKLAREAKLKQQAEWMSKVPKVDEDGIAYTKLQTRRMLKRVKKGLAPIPTKAEEEAMRRNEAQLRREEEAELAGMIFKRDEDDDDDDNDKEKDENEEDVENDDDDKEKEDDDDEDGAGEKEDKGMEESEDTPTSPAAPVRETPAKKKAKRSKPVPEDYVCSACKNKHTPVHWIYDCPDKVTMKGTNKKKKKLRGLHEPDANKVFVSGLPFDVKPKDILSLFQPCGKIASHKLVTFKDTGRCNGQAYVTFETQEAATKALKISGTSIGNISEDSSKKKKKSSDSSPKRKELKLKVSKVLNRRFTKGTTVK